MSDTTLFKVTIDNISIDVPAGTTILNAARMIGGDVAPPAMCYYSKLEGSGGKCRTCIRVRPGVVFIKGGNIYFIVRCFKY